MTNVNECFLSLDKTEHQVDVGSKWMIKRNDGTDSKADRQTGTDGNISKTV